jgi:glycine/D-amino acid oxidase-like deaminating enzyme
MKTVILGNGIIALTIAFRLTRRCGPNDRIVIVGPRARQGSATLAAAAMLNSFAEIEVGSLETELDLFRFELSHLATQMWPRFEKELIQAAGSCLPRGCAKCQGFSGGGCVECGTYVINNTAADDLDDENFDAILAALKNFNEPHELVSPRDIPNYMPEPHHRATRALYIPNEGWFNPRLMIEKLDAILGRHPQVQFLDHPVQRLQAAGGRIEAAVLDDGSVIAGDKFVLATGASVTDVLARSQLDLNIQRIFYGVGVSVEIRSPEFPHTKCIRTPNRGLACGIYSVPYFTDPDAPNDHILIGATNFISPTPYPHGRLGSAEPLMRGAMEQINTNFYKADLLRINVGWRPTSQDTYPLLGRTSLPNLLIASGTKRDGFHMSPLISEQIVAMLHDEATDPRLAWFAPDRAPIRSLTREQAITKAIRHQMSAAYQHGYAASPSLKSEQIRTMLRDGLERLHDQVGAVDWGIPPEMLDMYRYGHARP